MLRYAQSKKGEPMAQLLMSWFLSNGRFRVQAIDGIGRRKGRIIEVKVIATGERFYGSPRRMERLVRALQGSHDDRSDIGDWMPRRPRTRLGHV